MTSVTEPRPNATVVPPFSSDDLTTAPDVEGRALLALSILDHRMATRDRYDGAARDAFIAKAVHDARMALDGASVGQILAQHGAAT